MDNWIYCFPSVFLHLEGVPVPPAAVQFSGFTLGKRSPFPVTGEQWFEDRAEVVTSAGAAVAGHPVRRARPYVRTYQYGFVTRHNVTRLEQA